MKNTGTSTWGSGYQLAFRSGSRLGAPDAVSVPATAPGAEVDINVPLQVPTDDAAATYEGYWQLRNPQGTYFGEQVWFRLRTPGSQPPTGNAVNVELVGINSPSSVGPGQQFRPEITVRVTSGQLRESSGDMLRPTSGPNYSDFPHIGVVGTISGGQSYTFRFYNEHPMVAPTSPGTYESRWQVWANGGWVGPEIVIRFTVYQGGGNRPPNKPSLTSPNNWAVLVGQMPTLCAQSNGDPDGDPITQYRFAIFESAQLYDSGWVSSNCVTPQGLGNYGYQWHAKVRDSGGSESDWSDSRYFNIESSSVTITDFHFIPGSPSNTDTVVIWVETSGCGGVNVGGQVYVNTASDGSANGGWRKIKDIGPKTIWEDAPRWYTPEYVEGDHLVRVDMQSCDGSHTVQDQHYTVLRGRPSAPYLQHPSNGFWSDTRTITFRWKSSMRVNNYTLRVGTSEATLDTSPLLNVSLTATEYTYTFDQDYEHLYWKVSANNEVGVSTEGPWSVGIDRTPPTSAVSTSGTPSLAYENQFAVSWNGSDPASGVQNYDVQVRQEPGGAWTDWLTSYSYQSAIFTGRPGNTYCFRTAAHDIAGNAESYPASPDVCVKVDPSQRPPQAWWNSNYIAKRNVVVVNRMSGLALPAQYPVQLHFNSGTTPTASEIYAASRSSTKGDDVRVVYNDQTELARHVVNFTSTAIDVWFATNAEIAANGSSSAYQLYYGNPSPGTPPADLTQVYQPRSDSQTQALWHMEGSGSSTPDSSSHSNQITWANGPAFDIESGVYGKGVRLTGNQWGTAGAVSNDRITIEAWVWFDSLLNNGSDWSGAYGAYDSGENRVRWRLALGDYPQSHLRGFISIINAEGGRNDIDIVYQTVIQTNRWYHTAITYDGNVVRFWVNGDVVGEHTQAGRVDNRFQTLYIGRVDMGGVPMIGRLDGFRISNEARTSFPYAKINVSPTAAAGQELGQETIGPTDLAVQSMQAFPNPGGGLLVNATVKNQGAFPTYNEFLIHLYGNHTPTGPGDLADSVGFWVNAPVMPGATITLTTVLTPGVVSSMAHAETALGDRTVDLAAQVDSTGVVNESNRSNNILAGPQVCLASEDAFEEDETPGQARTLALDEHQTHNFARPGDQDWLKFNASAGVNYTLQTSNLDSSADTYLYLYDADGTTLLASNDDYGGTLASQIQWTAPADGTYYVLVRHWNPSAGGCGTSYEITLTPPNSAPSTPSPASPADGATGVPVTTVLTWSGGDPDPGDSVTYDVYLDPAAGPSTKVCSELSTTTCAPLTNLNPDTTYYWKVVATDNHGASSSGDAWHFRTAPEPPYHSLHYLPVIRK